MKRLFSRILGVAALVGASLTGFSQVDVTASGGTATASYTTLGAAFTAINAGTHTGTITVGISASTTETAATVLNSSGAGSASYTSILIQPTVDGVTISGPTVTGRGLIELNGADNVTINGDNPNSAGINRNLTISNTAANTVTYTSIIRFAVSTLITSTDNNSVLNCILNGSAGGAVTSANTSATTGGVGSTHGILVSGGASTTSATTAPSAIASNTTTIAAGQTALNFVANNNSITACGKGIYVTGAATSVVPVLTITNNTIGNPTAGTSTGVAWKGISVQGFGAGSVLRSNTIYLETYTLTTPIAAAIEVGGVSATGTGLLIEKNVIGRAYNNNTGGRGVTGINIACGPSNTVRNNFLYDIKNVGSASFSTTFGAFGILITAGNNHDIYHNSIHQFGSDPGTGNVMANIAFTGTSTVGVNVRNNIFSNVVTSASTTSSFVNVFFTSAPTAGMNLTINNNAYFTGSTAGLSGVGQLTETKSTANLYTAANFNPNTTSPATNWRAVTSVSNASNDNSSFASTSNAPFTANTDLHIPAGTATLLESGAAFISSVTDDIDGQARSSTPDIGADEFAGVACSGTPVPGTPAATTYVVCPGTSTLINVTGGSVGVSGLVRQFDSSSSATGPFFPVVGGTGGTTSSYTTAPLTGTNVYYRLRITCTNSGLTDSTVPVLVTVPSPPATQASALTNTVLYSTGATFTFTAGSGASRLVYINTTNSFSPPANGTTIPTAASTTYTGSGQQLIFNGTGSSVSVTGLTPNTPYYVAVFDANVCGSGTTATYYTNTTTTSANQITITTLTPPANDQCGGAISLTSSPTATCSSPTAGTTTGATQSTEAAPGCSAAGVDDDVFYSFVATNTSHIVQLSGATATTAGAIYSGSCGALTQLTGSCLSTTSGVVAVPATGLTVGATYYVRVYSTSSTPGTASNFSICIVTPAANDDCAGATLLTVQDPGNITYVAGNTNIATQSTGTTPTCSAAGINDDLWYFFTATSTSHALIYSGTTTTLASQVYSGACGALTTVVCSTASSSAGMVHNLTGLTIGTVYTVRVYTSTSTVGTTSPFNIAVVSNAASNDDCAGAIALTANSGLACNTVINGTTAFATTSTATAPTGCTTTGLDDDRWYSFTASGTSMRLTLNPANVTTNLSIAVQVYSGACGALVTTATGSCISATATSGSVLLTGLTSGNTYYARVWTSSTTTSEDGNYTICLAIPPAPPANDECAGAINIGTTPSGTQCTTGGTAVATNGATQSAQTASCTTTGIDDDVWYSFTATNSDVVISYNSLVTSLGTGTQVGYALYSGSCAALTQIACSSGFGTSGSGTSALTAGLTVGGTYYLRLFVGGASNSGTFNVCVRDTLPPVPAACAVISSPANNATSVSITPTISFGSVANATQYDIFLGTTVANAVLASTVTGTSATFSSPLAGNTTYVVYVVPKNSNGSATGCSANAISFTTVNDLPTSAITLTVNGTCTGNPYSNANATSAQGEPFPGCASAGGYSSVWFKFVAPASGSVRVTNDFSGGTLGEDTRLAVFSATDPANYATFTPIACDDDNGVTISTRSTIFAAGLTPAQTYYIVVDGYDGTDATGTFCLTVADIDSSMLATNASCPSTTSVSQNAGYTGWSSIVDAGGRAIANVRQATVNTASVTFAASYNVNTTGTIRNDTSNGVTGQAYLDRNFLVNVSSGTLAGSADIQFFYKAVEMAALQAASPGVTPASVVVTQQSGTTCTPTFIAANGNETVLGPTGSGGNARFGYVQVNVASFSNFFIHGGAFPLYAELTSVSAVNAGSRNRVDWTTGKEEAGDQFEVQRSANGRDFTTINTLRAKGTAASYSFWDEKPLAGVNYYRINMADRSGRATMSKVVTATVQSSAAFALQAFPNPATDVLTVMVGGQMQSSASLVLADATGKMLHTHLLNTGSLMTFDMHNLPAGLYLVRYTDGARTETVKVTKQ